MTGGRRRPRGPGDAVNALCTGGPFHGALVHVDQDLGAVDVADPRGGTGHVRYLITGDRVWHPSSDRPFTVLQWPGPN